VFSVIEVHRSPNGEKSSEPIGWVFDNRDEADGLSASFDRMYGHKGSVWFAVREES